MSAGEVVLIALAGLGAGGINALVGSGTLITFPVLLAFGYSPVTANVSNCVGLVPGSVAGALGYRRELAGQRRRIVRLGGASMAGGAIGALLLLVLPAAAFEAVVPAFIALALVLTLLAPAIQRRLQRGELYKRPRGRSATTVAVFASGIYGGYFGAAQGILLLAVLGIALAQQLQRTNALKNVLAGLVNGVAGAFFILAANVAWAPAALIAGGSIAGAQLGARYGRHLPERALRALIVLVAVAAIVRLLTE
jgi:uncharacterized membrane protein YfcA